MSIKKLCSIGLVLLLCCANLKAQTDQFAKIGGQKYVLNTNQLIEPGPPVLQNIQLPGGVGLNGFPAFKSPVETKEALYAELDSARKYYEPYLRNLVPFDQKSRVKLPITQMNWRVETSADRSEFSNTLQGKGSWEMVTIPHYGPPIGHAVTYYFKEINLGDEMLQKGSLFACFKGVDYKAEVYFNGAYCGMHEGFFAPFEFDVIKYAKKGRNLLLVKVINEPTTTGSVDQNGEHTVGDKIYAAGGLGYDDPVEGWHICPPAMGISQDCYLEARSTLFISDIFVRPMPNESGAEIWLEINNTTQVAKKMSLDISLFGQNFSDTVFINQSFTASTTHVPGIGDLVKPTDWQTKSLPMQYGVNYLRIPITIKNFRWWEPLHPWLYSMRVALKDDQNKLADIQAKQFGMRSFFMDTVAVPKGRMFLNNQLIRLRGANSMGFEQNDVKRGNWDQLRDDILLAKLCNMNFLRFTQRPVQSEVYDYCDRLGMLNQTDLPLFGGLRVNQFVQAIKQAEEMERLVRSHPSTIVVTYINERFPNAEGSPQRSLSDAASFYKLFQALDQAVLLSNPDRVIKPGDGDYDPPTPGLPDAHCYNTWYNGHALDLGKFHKGYWQLIKPNWLYGCGEFGAEGLDPINTMKKYYPKKWLPENAADDLQWTANRISKSQTNTFHYMWYPTQQGVEKWIEASQDYQAWAVKFVTEAFRRDSRNVSSAVHLFIDAWPAGWMKAIMDVDRQPKKAFFAYRDALSPLMVSLRTDRFSWFEGENASIEAWVCNDRNDQPANYSIAYEVVVDGKTIVRQQAEAKMPNNSAAFQGFIPFKIPAIKKRSAGTIKIGLFDANGKCIHQSILSVDLFSSPKKLNKNVFVLGDGKNKAMQLVKESNAHLVQSIENAQVVIIDDAADYTKQKEKVDAFVKGGGKVLLTELSAGEYLIADDSLSVKKTIMGNYYFANPAESLLRDKQFLPKDFFMWYDPKVDYIQPILYNVVKAKNWTPILTTGLCNFGGEDPSGYLAAGEYKHGKGKFVICEITLANRMKQNPSALLLLHKILSN